MPFVGEGGAFSGQQPGLGNTYSWRIAQDDAGMAIALDAAGNAIVGGLANSTDFPVTANAQQKNFGGNGPAGYTDPTGDAFVAKVSADGTAAFQYVSYYGGSSSDAITAVAVDGQGNVIVAGATTSTNLPVTASAAQKAFAGESSVNTTEDLGDAFVAVFSGITAVATGPVISSVVNDGSFTTALAPGSVAAVFGTNLGTSASAGATVGGQTAQVLLATATQWLVLVPYGAATGSSTIQVGASAPFAITLTQYAPALFSVDGSGLGNALATNSGGSAISAGAPAVPGSTITLYATGLGAINAGGSPTPLPTVTVGGAQVTVTGAAVLSSQPGTYQVTVSLPSTLAAGNAQVVLSIGGLNSQSLALPVGALTGVVVTAVANGASYGAAFTQGSWITIVGSNLSGTARSWTGSDFNGNSLPTQLDQVSVTVDGKPAYIYYISQTQIIALSPADTATVPVAVQVTYAGTKSNVVNGTEAALAPGLFLFRGMAQNTQPRCGQATGCISGRRTCIRAPVVRHAWAM